MWKESGILKNRIWLAVFLLEALLLTVGIAGLFRPAGVVSGTDQTQLLLTEGIALRPGVYRAVLRYEAHKDMACRFGVKGESELPFKSLRTNSVLLFADEHEAVCEFYLTASCKELTAYVEEPEEGCVQIGGIEILDTGGGSRILIFWVLVLSGLINSLGMVYCYQKKHPWAAEKQAVFAGLLLLIGIASLPLTVDYLVNGDSLCGNLTAVEAVGRNFGAIGSPKDLCLLLPALFRKLGLSMNVSYRLFLWVVNAATVAAVYGCVRRWLSDRVAALCITAVYVLNPYRLKGVYEQGNVAVSVGLVLLPLLGWLLCLAAEGMRKKGSVQKTMPVGRKTRIFLGVLAVCFALMGTYTTNRILLDGHPMWVYSMADMEQAHVRGLSWLLEETYGMEE